MRRHVFMASLWICAIAMAFPLLFSSTLHAEQNHARQRHVLLLHSYHQGMKWVDDVTSSVTATIRKYDPGIEFHVEYMDTKRVLGEEHLGSLYNEYRIKFKQERFDAVIVADDTALRFVLKYYNDLFPGIPVVFCGINNLEPGMLENRTEFTGVLERVDVEETLKAAFALHPNTRHVYVINDMSPTGEGLHKEIARVITSFASKADFTFLEDYTADELAAIIAKLPSNSIILRSAFFVDKSGRSLQNEKISYAAVGSSANMPVYSLWDFYMGLGIVGGKVVSGTAQGELAAQIAVRILNGEKPSTIPVTANSPNRLMFDYLQMQRFGIDRSSLPPGSEIVNEPRPFYSINKSIIWVGALFALAMTCITVLLVLNIHRRKQIEENLRESKERLKIIFEASQAGILLGDIDGKIIFCNSRLAEMLGFTPEELIGTSYSDYLHAADKSDGDDGLRLLLAGDIDYVSAERLFVRKDGTGFWGYLSARRTDVHDNGHTGLVGVIADISELRQVADALEAEKEQLAVTLSSIGDGVITVDTDGRVIMLNGVAEQLCGWSHGEAAGKPLTMVFPIINGKTGATQENPVAKALETGGVVELAENTILLARDGARRMIADSAAPMRNHEGVIVGVVLVFRDMTEKLNIEEELFKARKLDSLGVLAGGIAHDFNNLLTGIMGNISLAMMLLPAGEKPYALLDNAEKASVRARELTQQLLTFAKGGAPVKKTTSITDLLKDSADFVLRGSNIRCNFDFAADLWPVEADEGQISQVFNNLMINADQAMPEGGVLTVRTGNVLIDKNGKMTRCISIVIEDNGAGIPEEILNRVFDPYFTTKEHCSGLGLATVYSIIKRHEGEIVLNSEFGVGTSVTIHLPAAALEAPQKSLQNEAPPHGRGRVLVMDDEEIIRDVAAEILMMLGYEPVLCKDGDEALELCRLEAENGNPFAVVIMDLTIPGGMGGKDAVKKLLEMEPSAKVIVSSGYSNDPIMGSYRKYGFCGAITKPYHANEIGSILAAVLGFTA